VVPLIALAGLAGGLMIAGLALLLLALVRRDPGTSAPPQSAIRIRIGSLPRKRVLIAACAGLATLAVTRWPVAMIAAALAVLFLPRITSSRAAQRRAAALEGLEQWTRRLCDMLTASRGLEEALEASARQAPAAIGPAVGTLSRRLATRADTEAALRAFAADLDDPAGDRIAAALIIATGRRGGAVRDVLSALAGMLARDVAARREVEADRAQHRTTVKWLTLFVLSFTAFAAANRSYSAPYGTLPGQVVMALVVALYAGGLLWLHHLGSIPVAGRFLAADRSPTTGRSMAKTGLRQTGDRPAKPGLPRGADRSAKARPRRGAGRAARAGTRQRGANPAGRHTTSARRPT
jgi:Flp pilus assembly protein TadB